MIDSKLIREDLLAVAENLAQRGVKVDCEKLTALEQQRKSLQTVMQQLQQQRNALSKQVGQCKQQKKDASDLLIQVAAINAELKEKENDWQQLQKLLQQELLQLPNLLDDSVPFGRSEEDNQVLRHWGKPRRFDFTPQDHVHLGEQLQQMDFMQASQIASSRFVVLKKGLARLQRALIQFMLDLHTEKHGYEEAYVPYLANRESLFATGQLPKFAADLFHLEAPDNLYLIPTAEVPLTNLLRDKMLKKTQLPLKFVAHTPCFRSEAGSYGRDTRGMIRQHQFEKVELVQVTTATQSAQALEELTQHAENVLQQLELPYRVVNLCSADVGFASAKTYDIEVWLPAQNQYREISSCSNFKAFQARRLRARLRDEASKQSEFVHTLNGSALAVGRCLLALLENYQQASGDITIPDVLRPYMAGKVSITA